MSKVLIQILLSLVVVVSAAVGFSPDVKRKVSKTLREARTFTQEIARSILDSPHVEAESELSAEVSAEASGRSEAQVETRSETDASLNLDKSKGQGAAEIGTNADASLDQALEELSSTETETSISIESESQVEIKSKDLKLDLENEIESQLDLEGSVGN
jgi:hypothetical protein